MKQILPIVFVMLCVLAPVSIAWVFTVATSWIARAIALALYAAILLTILQLAHGAS